MSIRVPSTVDHTSDGVSAMLTSSLSQRTHRYRHFLFDRVQHRSGHLRRRHLEAILQ